MKWETVLLKKLKRQKHSSTVYELSMKSTFITILISLLSVNCAFSETNTINNLREKIIWKLAKDDQFDIQNKHPGIMVNVFVNHFINKNGKHLVADRVSINCDGIVSDIDPGASQICPLSGIGHYARIYISQDDYHNGADGTVDITEVN